MMKFQVNESGGMYYNKTMFEQAGLPDPYELQVAGEWTWDAMLDAAKKLTTGDVYGLSADPMVISEYSIFSNDAQFIDETTGELLIDSPNAIEALEFVVAYNTSTKSLSLMKEMAGEIHADISQKDLLR